MRTDEFIAALAEDTGPPGSPPQRVLWFAVAAGAVIACIVFWALLGPRPDFVTAVQTSRFIFKFVISLALAFSAFVALRQMVRPEMGGRPLNATLLTAPVLLLIAVVLELLAVPSAQWVARWIGQNSVHCMTFIPILSLGPLAVLLFVLRACASTAPAKTGALAGLLAGGIGAFFYAAHCPDDSPLFVACWYTIAITFVTGVGALVGARLLRW